MTTEAENQMSSASIALHSSLIRHLKGIIKAWEEWLKLHQA